MIHVSITTLDCTLVVPKHFTFTFMGSLQPSESEQREILKCQNFHFWSQLRIKTWKIFLVCSQNANHLRTGYAAEMSSVQRSPARSRRGALRTGCSLGLSPKRECNMLLTQFSGDT